MKFNLTSVLILAAVIVFSITAYHSIGFYHADEHYQIIEFAGLKAGWNQPHDLTWEYATRIRPTLQPTIGAGLISLFKVLGVTDPYTIAFLLRELTGLLFIFAVFYFFKQTKRFIQSSRKPEYTLLLQSLYLGFLLFIWYVPYLAVRFSSETWSAIFLILAMGSFCSENKTSQTGWITGLLFGVSFLFRFQILFALVGFGAWFLLFNRKNWKDLLVITTAFLLVFGIGILIDSWFYGKFTISVWNYFDQNILKHKAAEFGESSWDYYLNRMFHLPTKFIGTLLFLSLAAALIFRNKLPFIWMVLSFTILHMLVAHKEERFLFPIIFFFPVFFIQFLQLILEYIPKRISLVLVGLVSLGMLFTSIIGISVLAVNPAGIGRNSVTHLIHTTFDRQPVHLICEPYSDPYAPWFASQKFYEDPNVITTQIGVHDRGVLNSQLLKKDTVNLFVTRYPTKLQFYTDKNNPLKYRLIYQSVSENRLKLDKYVRSINHNEVIYLFELKE